MSHLSRGARALVAALIPLAVAVPAAQGASLTLKHACEFPLIETQPLESKIEVDLPSMIDPGRQVGPYAIRLNGAFSGDAVVGFKLLQAAELEGKATIALTYHLPGGFPLALDARIDVATTSIPASPGTSVEFTGTGVVPAVQFPRQFGGVSMTVDSIAFNLRMRKADGTVRPLPPVAGVPETDADPNTFDLACVLSPADQSTRLWSGQLIHTDPILFPPQLSLGVVTSSGVELKWTSADAFGDAERYEVYVGATKVATVQKGQPLRAQLTGLQPETSYSATVKAIDDELGGSVTSAPLTFRMPHNDAGLTNPGPPVISEIGPSSAKVCWAPAVPGPFSTGGPVAAYSVLLNTQRVGDTVGDVTCFTLTGLEGSDVGYSVVIEARDGSGATSRSVATVFFIRERSSEVVKPVATALTPNSEKLCWTAPVSEEAKSYHVYLNSVRVKSTTSTCVTVDGLAPGTTYEASVRWVAADGWESQPGRVQFTTTLVPPPVKYAYGVSGAAKLKTLTTGTVPLTGSVAAELSLEDGSFSADLSLAQSTARLVALGFLPVVAKVAVVQTQPIYGRLAGTTLTADAKVRIKLPQVTLFGIQLAGGSGCQTRSASSIALKSVGEFDALDGGTLTGTFAISDLVNCGGLTGLVSPLTAGGGNTIALRLAKTTGAAS